MGINKIRHLALVVSCASPVQQQLARQLARQMPRRSVPLTLPLPGMDEKARDRVHISIFIKTPVEGMVVSVYESSSMPRGHLTYGGRLLPVLAATTLRRRLLRGGSRVVVAHTPAAAAAAVAVVWSCCYSGSGVLSFDVASAPTVQLPLGLVLRRDEPR